jgi:hypothetical protein
MADPSGATSIQLGVWFVGRSAATNGRAATIRPFVLVNARGIVCLSMKVLKLCAPTLTGGAVFSVFTVSASGTDIV